MSPLVAIQLVRITKRFGSVTALEHADFAAQPGTVHALLGENGAGKSTLMRIAFGLLHAECGTLTVGGVDRRFASPMDAIRAGLGMVHQHYALVGAMTVAENVALGLHGRYDARGAAARVRRLSTGTGLALDPGARADSLSVEAQQRLEIIKALAREARILILDEPTAVLAPEPAGALLQWLRGFADSGGTVILITHKLREALSIADDVTVLRHGRTVLVARASATTEDALARAMLGDLPAPPPDPLLPPLGEGGGEAPVSFRSSIDEGALPPRPPVAAGDPAPIPAQATARELTAQRDAVGGSAVGGSAVGGSAVGGSAVGGVPRMGTEKNSPPSPKGRGARGVGNPKHAVIVADSITIADDRGVVVLRDASFTIYAGEIVGLAAVEGGGAGQHELLRAIAGRRPVRHGSLSRPGAVGFIPEDRQRDALVLDFPLYENIALRGAGGARGRRPWHALRANARALVAEFDIRTPDETVRVRTLSGGTQQRLVLARELADPTDARTGAAGAPPTPTPTPTSTPSAALVAENPTRGLDLHATAAVHARLRAARDRGTAIVLYASDIDETLALADRILVLAGARLREVPRDRAAVGHAMLGLT